MFLNYFLCPFISVNLKLADKCNATESASKVHWSNQLQRCTRV